MLRYLTKENEEGTRVRAVGGNVAGQDWRSVEREFRLTREQFGAEDGIRYHHASLSMDPRDMGSLSAADGTPDYQELVRLGEQWAERNGILERHQVLVVAHGDKPHPHVHICWSSVDRQDGSKWHSDRAFLERARDATDALGREHGIRHEPSREKNASRPPDKVLRAAARGADPYSWKVDLRKRIADAARSSVHEDDFKKKLAQHGVEVRRRGEAYTFSFPDESGKTRVARASRLGEEYQRGPLLERFEAQGRELQRGQEGVEAFARRLRQEKGSPLRSWRGELRRTLSEARRTAMSLDDYQEKLAQRGIAWERTAGGGLYTMRTAEGQARSVDARALGPAYSQERLAARFAENSRAPSNPIEIPAISRAATRIAGLAERIAGEIDRESHAGHADTHDYRPRSRRDSRLDDRDGRDRF